MSDWITTRGLVQTWTPVTDSDGRVHLEAHWVAGDSTPASITPAA